MSSSRKPNAPSPVVTRSASGGGKPASDTSTKPGINDKSKHPGKAMSVADKIGKTSEKSKETKSRIPVAVAVEKFNSLPAKLQKEIVASCHGDASLQDESENVDRKAATFLKKSFRGKQSLDIDKEELQKLVEIAGEENLKDLKQEDKVVVRNGESISLSSILKISPCKPPEDTKENKSSTTQALSTADVQKQNKQDSKSATQETKQQDQSSATDKNAESELADLKIKFDAREVELQEKERTLQEQEERIQVLETKLATQEGYLKQKENKIKELNEENEGICKTYDEKAKAKDNQIEDYKQQLMTMHEEFKKLTEDKNEQFIKFSQCKGELEKAKRNIEYLKETHEDKMRHKDNQIKQIVADRDDLRHRFSKLAGAKLTDQNPDIADLSDPNRAMKLSEKFGGLYDDQWTDAFEELKGKKKMPVKDAIALLLDVLKKCEQFCYKLKDQQMDSLRNVLLHPAQDVASFGSEPRKHVGGFKEHARISSDDQKAVNVLRRQVNVKESVLEEVKQVFVMETKSWPEKKNLEGCLTYLQKCAEICWLMVLHDPPLYMKMDVERGEKLDPNLYSVYSASGNNIDFLVWPPLFNDKNGGLLSKGTAEAYKIVKK